MVVQPLVLTVRLDRRAFLRLEKERRRFFPAARNFVPAHISLFHALPGEEELRVHHVLADLAAETAVLPLCVTGLIRLGGGVAYRLQSSGLFSLRHQLALEFRDSLTKQDQQPFRPHVTIQNKVSREEAEVAHLLLSSTFVPFELKAVGLCLWEYLNGPWRLHRQYRFIRTND